jgi:hypothetical protein
MRAAMLLLQTAVRGGSAEANYILGSRTGLETRQSRLTRLNHALGAGVIPAVRLLIRDWPAGRTPGPEVLELRIKHRVVPALVVAIELSESDPARTAWLWRRLRETQAEDQFADRIALSRVSPRLVFRAARSGASFSGNLTALRFCLDADGDLLDSRARALRWLQLQVAEVRGDTSDIFKSL